jgi:predicted ATPase with chaperone activity
MRRFMSSALLAAICAIASSTHAQTGQETDSDYLQHRAGILKDRIDIAVADRKLTRKKAAALRLSVGRVQTMAGNLQARRGTIARPDADRLNQQLTDVERALPLQH